MLTDSKHGTRDRQMNNERDQPIGNKAAGARFEYKYGFRGLGLSLGLGLEFRLCFWFWFWFWFWVKHNPSDTKKPRKSRLKNLTKRM
nr:hypothetical protein BCU61_03315 [Vibrio splendidus]